MSIFLYCFQHWRIPEDVASILHLNNNCFNCYSFYLPVKYFINCNADKLKSKTFFLFVQIWAISSRKEDRKKNKTIYIYIGTIYYSNKL